MEWQNVAKALNRCHRLKCAVCGEGDAPLGCKRVACKKNWHYPCAMEPTTGLVIYEDEFCVACPVCHEVLEARRKKKERIAAELAAEKAAKKAASKAAQQQTVKSTLVPPVKPVKLSGLPGFASAIAATPGATLAAKEGAKEGKESAKEGKKEGAKECKEGARDCKEGARDCKEGAKECKEVPRQAAKAGWKELKGKEEAEASKGKCRVMAEAPKRSSGLPGFAAALAATTGVQAQPLLVSERQANLVSEHQPNQAQSNRENKPMQTSRPSAVATLASTLPAAPPKVPMGEEAETAAKLERCRAAINEMFVKARCDEIKLHVVAKELRSSSTTTLSDPELERLLTDMERDNLVMSRIGIVFLI